MKIVRKYNEFLDSNLINESLIRELIKKGEFTTSADLEYISNREPYKKIIEMGDIVIPYLFESDHLLIWDIALSEIVGINLPKNFDSNQRVIFWKNWATKNGY